MVVAVMVGLVVSEAVSILALLPGVVRCGNRVQEGYPGVTGSSGRGDGSVSPRRVSGRSSVECRGLRIRVLICNATHDMRLGGGTPPS